MNFLLRITVCRVCMQSDGGNSITKNLSLKSKFESVTHLKLEDDDNMPDLICEKCCENLKMAYDFIKTAKTSHKNLKKFLAKVNNDFKTVTQSVSSACSDTERTEAFDAEEDNDGNSSETVNNPNEADECIIHEVDSTGLEEPPSQLPETSVTDEDSGKEVAQKFSVAYYTDTSELGLKNTALDQGYQIEGEEDFDTIAPPSKKQKTLATQQTLRANSISTKICKILNNDLMSRSYNKATRRVFDVKTSNSDITKMVKNSLITQGSDNEKSVYVNYDGTTSMIDSVAESQRRKYNNDAESAEALMEDCEESFNDVVALSQIPSDEFANVTVQEMIEEDTSNMSDENCEKLTTSGANILSGDSECTVPIVQNSADDNGIEVSHHTIEFCSEPEADDDESIATISYKFEDAESQVNTNESYSIQSSDSLIQSEHDEEVEVSQQGEMESKTIVFKVECQQNESQSTPHNNFKDQLENAPSELSADLSQVITLTNKSLMMSSVSNDLSYYCLVCNRDFSTKTNLKRHLQIHSGVKPFKCEICEKSFTQRGSLKQHMVIHSGEKPYVCSVCNRGFTQPKSLVFHERRHTGEKPFICDYCQTPFRQKDGLRTHLLKHHTNVVNKDNRQAFVCKVCQKDCSSADELQLHLKKHVNNHPIDAEETSNDIFPNTNDGCILNDAGSSIEEDLLINVDNATHIIDERATSAVSVDRAKRYQCRICFKCFAIQKNLIRHLAVHETPVCELQQCDVCDLVFEDVNELSNHKNLVHNFKCSLCPSLTFSTKQRLELHSEQHFDEFDETNFMQM